MARRFFVDELLQDGRVKQSNTTNEEASVNPFDRRVVNADRPQGRVDDVLEYWDHQNDGSRVGDPTRKKRIRRVPAFAH